MGTRTLLYVLGTGALLLAVILAAADAPAWGWGGVAFLAGVTFIGAAVAPAGHDERGRTR